MTFLRPRVCRMFIDRVRMVLICAKPGAKKARRIKPRLITIYLVIVFGG